MALIEGCYNLYNRNKYTDVTLVCTDEKKFNCHKFVLGAVSQWFEKKFMEDNENTREINLEITSDAFQVVIDYIYRDQLKIDSENVAMNLYKFAFLYEFKKLMQEVMKYFSKNLTIRSALICLNHLKDFGLENMMDCCKTVIKENVREVIECEEFLDCPLELVVELTSLEALNVSEIDLFKGVEKWMDRRKEIEGAGCEDNLKIFYRELVRNIRFLTLIEAEFLSSPFNSYLLTNDDKMNLIANICIPNSAPLPEGFTANKLSRDLSKLNVFKNVIGCSLTKYIRFIRWQTLNIPVLNFNNDKEHVSSKVELEDKSRFRITMKLNMNNNEHCITIGIQYFKEIAVCVSCHLYVKNVFGHFEYFRNLRDGHYFTPIKNETVEFAELSLNEIRDKGCLIDENIEFQVEILF